MYGSIMSHNDSEPVESSEGSKIFAAKASPLSSNTFTTVPNPPAQTVPACALSARSFPPVRHSGWCPGSYGIAAEGHNRLDACPMPSAACRGLWRSQIGTSSWHSLERCHTLC